MAIKKSELYSSLWASCDELRGGMDASQYKDYVLVLLFIKYISDKFAGQPYAPIIIPPGASFADMVALKGKSDIGDLINKQIIAPLASANQQLSQSDFPDFNDSVKLGDGKEKVDKLTNLISIFQDKALDFSKNRAEGDDILGDAYEYLMRHFATESGKSKGQFYTPAEVSRVIAKTLGIGSAKTTGSTTVYDPTCGSGSLLLKVADEAPTKVTLNGQEKDATTSGLARMNMILHDNAEASIQQGNTLADPKFKNGEMLQTFDYVVANPPFSDKRWSNGIDPLKDPYDRFQHFGVPPNKQGDFAYLLHIVRSLKSTGKGACILPHGVLFRGNAEAEIRRNLIRKGYIKGIIGLPPNLFYGTGIPACIILIDKEDAHTRKGIFMIDASAAYIKDGPKNRLRDQDIHKIVDVFTKRSEVAKYSRMVSVEEIEKNEFNLNLPRYIDSSAAEDLQDINAHLRGGIPNRDIDAFERYWQVMPDVRNSLFRDDAHDGYSQLKIPIAEIKPTIFGHSEFETFKASVVRLHSKWEEINTQLLKGFAKDGNPKALIETIAEDLLATFEKAPLLDRYDVYQHLMDYWAETMQDDCYIVAIDGWVAETYRIIEKDKKGKEKDKGWTCDLVPKHLIVARYFAAKQEKINEREAEQERLDAEITEMEEEHGGEDGAFSEIGKITLTAVRAHLKYLAKEGGDLDESDKEVLLKYLDLCAQEAVVKQNLSVAVKELDAKAYAKYPTLSVEEIKTLVIEDKWLIAIAADIQDELDRVSQTLTGRVRQIAERYETPLPQLVAEVAMLSARVDEHLQVMGEANIAAPQLLTGQTRLTGYDGEWSQLNMADHSILKARIGWQGLTTDEYLPTGEYYLVTGTDFLDGHVEWTKCCFVTAERFSQDKYIQLRPKDILLTKDGTIGKVAFVDRLPGPATLNSGVFVIRPKDDAYDPQFFYYVLTSRVFEDFLNKLQAGSTINHLYQKDFVTFTFQAPGSVAEQKAIAEVLAEMDLEIAVLERRREKALAVKQGMMQHLLTGRKRRAEISENVVPFPERKDRRTAKTLHNPQFNEAVVIAAFANRFSSEEWPLSRFKYTKFGYLLHRHAEHVAEGYLKKAAGPYNPRTRYGGAEKIAQKKKYIRKHKNEKYEGFVADENISEANEYFEKWYGADELAWLEQFRYKKHDELELLTTVDMALECLRKDGMSTDFAAVKQLIHDEPEWLPKLDRDIFSDENIEIAINESCQLFNRED